MTDDLQTDALRIMEMAMQRSLTLATAESCTAGALVHLLAEAPARAFVRHNGARCVKGGPDLHKRFRDRQDGCTRFVLKP